MKSSDYGAQRAASILAVLVTCFAACSDPAEEDPIDPSIPGTGVSADVLSDHLSFFGATKRQGSSPAGTSTGTLQIAVKDTLHLAGTLQKPVQIRHIDTTGWR